MAFHDELPTLYKVYKWEVYIQSILIPTIGSPQLSRSFGQVCAVAQIPVATWPDVAVEGAPVSIYVRLNEQAQLVYVGAVHQPARSTFQHTITAIDSLWPATLSAPSPLSWEDTEDGEIVVDLLEAARIYNHAIAGTGWVMGTLYPVELARRQSPATLIEEIDRLAGALTRTRVNLVVRYPQPLYPGAVASAVYRYAYDPTGDELPILDQPAQLGGAGRDGIRNRTEVEGAVLRQDLTQTVTDEEFEVGEDEHDTWLNLPHPPNEGTLVVTDEAGTTTYLEGPDYEVDYEEGTFKPLGSGDIPIPAEGETTLLLLTYTWTEGGSGTQIEAALQADNPYLPAGVVQTHSVSSVLIQSFSKAEEIAVRAMRDQNRMAVTLQLTVALNPLLHLGDTITYRDPTVGLIEETAFLVTGLSHQDTLTRITAIGGAGGDVGEFDNRTPIALFDYSIFVIGSIARVRVNGTLSWDPDNDTLTYAWTDDESPANTATGPLATFVYNVAVEEYVIISLVVTDEHGAVSAIYARELNLTGSDEDRASGRYQEASLYGRWQSGAALVRRTTILYDPTVPGGSIWESGTPRAAYFNRSLLSAGHELGLRSPIWDALSEDFGSGGSVPTPTRLHFPASSPPYNWLVKGDPVTGTLWTTYTNTWDVGRFSMSWQWWDREQAVTVLQTGVDGPDIYVQLYHTRPAVGVTRLISESVIQGATLEYYQDSVNPALRGLKRLHAPRVWFPRSQPSTIYVAARESIWRTTNGGQNWTPWVDVEDVYDDADPEEYGFRWLAVVGNEQEVAYMISDQRLDRGTAAPVAFESPHDHPVTIGSTLEQPVFPDPIVPRSIIAHPTRKAFVVNCLYLLDVNPDTDLWRAREIVYPVGLDTGLTTIGQNDTWRTLLHPTEDDILILNAPDYGLDGGIYGAAYWAFSMDWATATATYLAEDTIPNPGGDPWYPEVILGGNAPWQLYASLAVAGPGTDAITPIEVVSDATTKVLRTTIVPDNWADPSFDDTAWDASTVLG